MTEKQIERLKIALSSATESDNSAELDELILKAAYDAAQLTQSKLKNTVRPRKLHELMPTSFLRAASLAVVFTFSIFFVMGQVTSVDRDATVLNNVGALINNVTPEKPFKEPFKEPAQIAISRPSMLPYGTVPSSGSRDQLVMSFELSNVEGLMAKLPLNTEQGSALNRRKAALAMEDINALIHVGKLDNARQRYSELLADCDNCGLPKTLEGLIIAVQNSPILYNKLDTG